MAVLALAIFKVFDRFQCSRVSSLGIGAPGVDSPEGGRIDYNSNDHLQGGWSKKSRSRTMQPMLGYCERILQQQARANKATIEQQESDIATAYAAIPVQTNIGNNER